MIVKRSELPKYAGPTPTLTEFDPRYIPAQLEAIRTVRTWDYSKGKLQVLLSGALGSSKSAVLAHIVVTHCLMFPNARACVARRTLPDVKKTILKKIIEHMGELKEGLDYTHNQSTGYIRFQNGSEIEARSWGDRKGGMGARSVDLSLLCIEELTENDEVDRVAIMELLQRVERAPNIPENLFIAATNPDDPSHWVYKYFIDTKDPSRKVIYSLTTDNPFLPKNYRQELMRDLDPLMVERMIKGRWISIAGDGVYYQYDAKRHEPQNDYVPIKSQPIVMSFDFNIGAGKPMSASFSQMNQGVKHFFDEVVIEGARTENILEDAWNRGLFDTETQYLVRGDASGTHRDTRNILNDYLIIQNWLNSKVRKNGTRIIHQRQVPTSNPPVRERHNVVNAWLLNNLGEVRIQVYPKAKVLRDGFKLVKLRTGAQYIEDDSKYFQHVTTAAGYDIHYENILTSRPKTEVRVR